MGSKIDKSGFEDSKEDWGRVESAGGENKLGMELPVYYLEAGQSSVISGGERWDFEFEFGRELMMVCWDSIEHGRTGSGIRYRYRTS